MSAYLAIEEPESRSHRSIFSSKKKSFRFFTIRNDMMEWIFLKIGLFFILGAIFEQGTDEVQSAFKFAMLNHNLNITSRRFELQAYVDVINTADAFKLSRLSKCHASSTNFPVVTKYYRDIPVHNSSSTSKHPIF